MIFALGSFDFDLAVRPIDLLYMELIRAVRASIPVTTDRQKNCAYHSQRVCDDEAYHYLPGGAKDSLSLSEEKEIRPKLPRRLTGVPLLRVTSPLTLLWRS